MNITKHKVLGAGATTILLFGLLHIFVLLVVFLKTGNFSIFNIARILEINLILPVDIVGTASNIISFVFVALVYGIAYFRSTR